ncbi:enoyl-CoA hydratase/isomerase family protein [Rhodococcus sp. BP-149]|uniref:enoyl-CoA hydratase/isomerase family protein n=1 Tax=unclassified Rhodococcus (in: high G+C Gram-positive bacteria) TaxID=192944 RepID=UPI001C9AFED7|nr:MULTISPECIES: enoyl-CoA hydratase/isomerase family protein [unclassified Rhodococcus (in: high G+C Gram-positive bacteria)]MBY6687774.1 enoyl-CoA hydratase/isomerase family protein [Rhodococcus sp. BP-288]MBY6696039.1 enoyl-CoA hydratase/isomerase family protein [Rhodococcus sp. BP-188]MBY6700636.1 enoyl-CoA hydratase/isomerase family protein [Rhodococcus sp. BP-285]MBY6705033.1 enoyl-CoA hydratase/isomerase family protein [Rhodococcus sp. BP-283]MBY6713761.1 enoyl-CoA hydratase/isomerase f
MCERMAFTLTETHIDDTRFVQVPSITEAMEVCRDRVDGRPMTTAVLLDVLGAFARHGDVEAGLLTESLAYSTLQAGPEFHEWLADRKPARRHEQDDSVRLVRDGGRLDITFDRPDRHNAFSDSLRAGLLEGLVVAAADPSVTGVMLRGNGPSFCSGGDLGEFGLSADPASAHLARTLHSPARLLEELRSRSSTSLGADVHGAVMGSGLEMASFCDTVTAHPDSVFGLPELNLGLIPGAGGTVSVTRRIGRWRTAYLVVSGARIDSPTALRWGLIDAIAAR